MSATYSDIIFLKGHFESLCPVEKCKACQGEKSVAIRNGFFDKIVQLSFILKEQFDILGKTG